MSPMTATGFELFLAVAPYSCSDLVRTYADLKTFARTVFTRFGPKTRAMARSGAGFIIGNTTKTDWQSAYTPVPRFDLLDRNGTGKRKGTMLRRMRPKLFMQRIRVLRTGIKLPTYRFK